MSKKCFRQKKYIMDYGHFPTKNGQLEFWKEQKNSFKISKWYCDYRHGGLYRYLHALDNFGKFLGYLGKGIGFCSVFLAIHFTFRTMWEGSKESPEAELDWHWPRYPIKRSWGVKESISIALKDSYLSKPGEILWTIVILVVMFSWGILNYIHV